MDNVLSVLYILLLLLWPSEPTWIGEQATEEEWIILKQLSYDLEICSPGVESWNDDWKSEINWCRHAWRTSWHLPPLAWSSYLPDHAVCKSNSEFAGKRLEFLSLKNDALCSVVKDQHSRHLIWGWAADATDPKRTTASRRTCLASLLEYQKEGLPNYVNLAYYQEKE